MRPERQDLRRLIFPLLLVFVDFSCTHPSSSSLSTSSLRQPCIRPHSILVALTELKVKSREALLESRIQSRPPSTGFSCSMGTTNPYGLGARDQQGARTLGSTGDCLRQSKDDNIQDEYKVSHSSSSSVVIADHTRVQV